MGTTLNIDHEVMREVKRRAANQGVTLTHVVEEALRQWLATSKPTEKMFRLQLLTMKGELLPGVDISDRGSVYDRIGASDQDQGVGGGVSRVRPAS